MTIKYLMGFKFGGAFLKEVSKLHVPIIRGLQSPIHNLPPPECGKFKKFANPLDNLSVH
jgi:hypothetical protein